MLSNIFSVFFFFKQKTAYEMRISDWSSDVCSSDLVDLAISRQENALSVLTGRAPAAIRPRAKLSGLQAPPLPGGLPSTLLRRRPDIAQAELSLAASDATLAAPRAHFLPTLRPTGSAGGLFSDPLPDPKPKRPTS